MSTHTITRDEVKPTAPASQPLLLADAGVIRAAIMDVVDEGEVYLWSYQREKADLARADFADAVEKRIRELQASPFDLGIKLENYCASHIAQRLGIDHKVPTVISCADCDVRDGRA